jgi:hypothetical protein
VVEEERPMNWLRKPTALRKATTQTAGFATRCFILFLIMNPAMAIRGAAMTNLRKTNRTGSSPSLIAMEITGKEVPHKPAAMSVCAMAGVAALLKGVWCPPIVHKR